MDHTWEQLYVELREILRKIPGLRNYDGGQYSPDRIKEARRLATRFGELVPEFRRFEHSDEKLSDITDYVGDSLPLKAGGYLCDLFDRRLFRTPGSASIFNKSDLRMMSGMWCNKQLESLEMAPEPASQELRTWLASRYEQERRIAEEYRISLGRLSAIEAGDIERHYVVMDRHAVRFCWWGFIRKLAECEAHRNRMRADVLEHWLIVETFNKLLNGAKSLSRSELRHGSEDELQFQRKLVRGETEEDRSLLRLRHEAGIQATACEIVAELLEQVIEVEEQQLSREEIPPKRPKDDSGIAEHSDPSKMPDEFGYVADPTDRSAYMAQSEVIAAETPCDLGITAKKMKVILQQYEQNRIRWTRPLKKNGEPRSNRCCIHLTDWKAYVRRITGINEDGSPAVTPDEAAERELAIGLTKLIDREGK